MKKLLVGSLILGSLSSFAGTIILHKNCHLHNDSYSILNKEGRYTDSSFEKALLKKGYTIVTSEDDQDSFKDILRLTYRYNRLNQVEPHAFTIQGFKDILESDTAYVSTGRSFKRALKNLPSCRVN